MFLLLTYILTGHHIIPYWPSSRLVPLQVFTVLFHCGVIGFAGKVFLELTALHWMSSLCVACSVHLLADKVIHALTWPHLLAIVKLNQRLVVDARRIQTYFAEDLSLVARLMLLLGVIGAFRASLGIQDASNVIILVTVFTFVAILCVTGQLQGNAEESLYTAICQHCPWWEWPVAQRRLLCLALDFTVHPSQVTI
ncbi:hypothetical protein ONE63_003427 [Megalurothrips usitatus]|uniref:Uncharacterized protein n=1 Tax=Megalurothrips usitatus TaxID=439358 RepID=A0AAV7XAS4_9NEOP|nr:hypothetical protein ONE63_003427 [Megalurothrips usitatus]